MNTDLAWIDLQGDGRPWADSRTRYQAYLRRNIGLFFEEDTPAGFAVSAWVAATGPIMSPGFVQIREDLHALSLRVDQDGYGTLLACVQMPVSAHALRASHHFADAKSWARSSGMYESAYRYHAPLLHDGDLAVLPSVELQLALDNSGLPPVPACDGSPEHAETAERALIVVLNQLRRATAHVDRLRAG